MNRQYIKNKRKETRPAALMFIVISLLLPIPVFANNGPAVWIVTKLSSSEPSIGGVGSYSISPDENYLVFEEYQNLDSDGYETAGELYSVPIARDSEPTRISQRSPDGEAIGQFSITSDSRRVVYIDQHGTSGFGLFPGAFQIPNELYSVPIEGGTISKLNLPLANYQDVNFFRITPDDTQVVYVADQTTLDLHELYVVPIEGGEVKTLNADLIASGDVTNFQITPDGNRVIYVADQEIENRFELYSVPLAGGPVTKLNGPMINGGSVNENFLLSPDGSHLVYVADQDKDERDELYSVSLSDGEIVKLNSELVSGGNVLSGNDPRLTADGAYVVYRADQEVANRFELFSVPIEGGAVTKLNMPLEESSYINDYILSPAGTHVAYSVLNDGVTDLYTVPINGGQSSQIDIGFEAIDEVREFEFTSDNSKILFLLHKKSDNMRNLYVAPVSGGDTLPLNDAFRSAPDFTRVSTFELSPDSDKVVMQMETWSEQGNYFELYLISISGENLIRLSEIKNDFSYFSAGFGSSGGQILFYAEQDTSWVRELYSASILPEDETLRLFLPWTD